MTLTLSHLLAGQSDQLTRLAHQLATEGQARVAAALAVHAAQLAAHQATARRLELELSSTQASLSGARAALAQARATADHLEAEIREEATLPPPTPRAVYEERRAIIRGLTAGLPGTGAPK